MKNIGLTIAEHRKAAHLTQHDLSLLLSEKGFSVSSKAVSAWESGQTTPPLETFFALCSIFNIKDISEAFSLKGEAQMPNPDLSKKLSLLNSTGIARVNEYVSLLTKDEQFVQVNQICKVPVQHPTVKPLSSRKKTIRLYDMPVSAGTGNFLEESTYEEIEKDSSIPSNADFGVRISGDSMEPRYKNSEIIWIKQQNALESGEIGIFLYDGNAYCKKYSRSKSGINLVSLNKKYAPIPVVSDSDLIIFGKVL